MVRVIVWGYGLRLWFKVINTIRLVDYLPILEAFHVVSKRHRVLGLMYQLEAMSLSGHLTCWRRPDQKRSSTWRRANDWQVLAWFLWQLRKPNGLQPLRNGPPREIHTRRVTGPTPRFEAYGSNLHKCFVFLTEKMLGMSQGKTTKSGYWPRFTIIGNNVCDS